jgi:hypothetical protein
MQQYGPLTLDDSLLCRNVQENWVNTPRVVREDRLLWMTYSCPECVYVSLEPDWLWHLQTVHGRFLGSWSASYDEEDDDEGEYEGSQ